MDQQEITFKGLLVVVRAGDREKATSAAAVMNELMKEGSFTLIYLAITYGPDNWTWEVEVPSSQYDAALTTISRRVSTATGYSSHYFISESTVMIR